MVSQKAPFKLYSKLFSIVLVFAFLIPLGLKSYHGYKHHSNSKLCEHTKIHFHTSYDHNDILDDFFLPLFKNSINYHENKNVLTKRNKNIFYNSRFSSFSSKLFRSRAPPVFEGIS
nr:hypothetical protein [uncultured bacterium]